jgi:hypothetical protein
MFSPMMDTIAAPIMKGALILNLLEKYTVVHIEKLASTFGGTVILMVGIYINIGSGFELEGTYS